VLGCDRVTVLSCRGGRPKTEAISGVESFDRRSGVVKSLEVLARSVLESSETFWSPDGAVELPPQVSEQLQSFVDESSARGLGIIPLRAAASQDGEAVGLLCVEQFGAELDEALRRRSLAVAQASGGALASALDYDRIPLRGLMEWMGALIGWRSRRRIPPLLLAAAAVVAAAVALCLIPSELTIESRGQLMPARRQHVFAPSDGTVVELLESDGAAVALGQILARLHSPALDIQQSELVGKQRTVQEDLIATETEALRSESEGGTAQPRRQLTARALQLTEELRGLESQLAILREQLAQLEVKSPITGTVVTWDAERQIAGRPVKRGDSLLTIADLAGSWELLLDVPDRRAGHVLAARKTREELLVTFQLGTDPGTVRRGMIKVISPATEVTTEREPTVRVTAALADAPPTQLRPGATVIARIHCGRRSLAYVWLHEFWEAVRLRLFL
jgi:multidrug efflux pump subunit AcrA (membrane-fusion protein)